MKPAETLSYIETERAIPQHMRSDDVRVLASNDERYQEGFFEMR